LSKLITCRRDMLWASRRGLSECRQTMPPRQIVDLFVRRNRSIPVPLTGPRPWALPNCHNVHGPRGRDPMWVRLFHGLFRALVWASVTTSTSTGPESGSGKCPSASRTFTISFWRSSSLDGPCVMEPEGLTTGCFVNRIRLCPRWTARAPPFPGRHDGGSQAPAPCAGDIYHHTGVAITTWKARLQ